MITKRTLLPLLTLSFLLSITSCKNFLSGSDFLNELQDSIAYTNTESFNVIVEADSVLGKISDSGKKEVKVKDKLSLSFEVNSEKYAFLGWTCVKAESGEDASANVEFVDILSPKTTVKFLKPGDVTIKPKCAERPYVKNFSPTYDQTGVGVAKNTSIIIEFAQKIETSETEDILNKIIIESNGPATSKFSPSMNEKIITFVSKELIDLKNGTQDVTVKVPGSYYYTTKDVKGNNVKVYLSPAYNGENEVYDAHSYLINSTTSEKTEIYFSVDTELGKLDYTGQKTLNVGDEFQVTFTNNKGYSFKNWNITADGYTEEELKRLLTITTDDSQSDFRQYTLKGTVTKSIKGITIVPVCNIVPKVLNIYVKDNKPEYEISGAPQDSIIVIEFNKPVALSDFFDSNNKVLKNITITDKKLNDYSSNINRVEINETSTILELIPDEAKSFFQTDDEKSTVNDLTVTVTPKTLKDTADNVAFEEDFTGKYRVNRNKETEKPVIKEVHVYRTKNSDGIYTDELEEDLKYSDWDEKKVKKQQIKNSFYFVIRVSEETNISKLKIKQIAEVNTLGSAFINIDDEIKYFDFKKIKDTNEYEAVGEYEFDCKYKDGAYQVQFIVEDSAGNAATEIPVYYVLKDTSFVQKNFLIWNNYNNIDNIEYDYHIPQLNMGKQLSEYEIQGFNIEEMKKNILNVYFEFADIAFNYGNKDYFSSLGEGTLKVFINKIGKDVYQKECSKTETPNRYLIKFTEEELNETKDFLITIVAEDNMGNECIENVKFPGRSTLFNLGFKNPNWILKNTYSNVETSNCRNLLFMSNVDFSKEEYKNRNLCFGSEKVDSGTKDYFYCSVSAILQKRISSAVADNKYLYGLPSPVLKCTDSFNIVRNDESLTFDYEVTNIDYINKRKIIKITNYPSSVDEQYFICLTTDENDYSKYTFYSNDEITINFTLDHYISLVKYDSEKIYISKSKKENKLTYTEDKTPPKPTSGVLTTPVFDNFVISFEDRELHTNYAYGFDSSNNYKVPVKYWIRTYEESLMQLTKDKILAFADGKETFGYIPKNYQTVCTELDINIPIIDLSDGVYSIATQVFDKAGNEYCGFNTQHSKAYLYTGKNRYEEIKYSEKNGEPEILLKRKMKRELPDSISGVVLTDDNYVNIAFFYHLDENESVWTTYDEDPYEYENVNIGDSEFKEEGELISITINHEKYNYLVNNVFKKNKRKYIKIFTQQQDQDSPEYTVRYIPEYLYIGEDNSVNKRIITEYGTDSYIVSSNKPFVVETFVSSIGYGENVDDWLLKAQCLSPEIIDGSGLYVVNTDAIDKGMHYCIILHYADGSSKMSEVRRKK